VVKSDGAIYFTDPWAGPRAQEPPGEADLTFAGVFRISPDRGTLTLLVDDFLTPNGEINAALADPRFKARLAEGFLPMSMTAGQFSKFIADDTEKWGKVMRAANIKAQ